MQAVHAGETYIPRSAMRKEVPNTWQEINPKGTPTKCNHAGSVRSVASFLVRGHHNWNSVSGYIVLHVK